MKNFNKVTRAAHAEILSLISDGYRRKGFYTSPYCEIILLRHKTTGKYLTIKRNNSIIKKFTL